ncbi:MAG: hypothetical protein ACYC35_01675 [Pirellulales bacterium]
MATRYFRIVRLDRLDSSRSFPANRATLSASMSDARSIPSDAQIARMQSAVRRTCSAVRPAVSILARKSVRCSSIFRRLWLAIRASVGSMTRSRCKAASASSFFPIRSAAALSVVLEHFVWRRPR